MKKRTNYVFILLLFILIGLTGCHLEQSVYQNELFLASQKSGDGIVTKHKPIANIEEWKTVSDDFNLYESLPDQYADVMAFIEREKGIVVAGFAYGDREGYYEAGVTGYTLTDFKIEHIFWGDIDTTEIEVLETYVLYEEDGKLCRYVENGTSTNLQNDELVLLYLSPSVTGVENRYRVVCRENVFKLSEDYLDYDEEYKNSLFAFYNGDRTEYAFPEVILKTLVVELSDGSTREELIRFENVEYWPETTLSQDELLSKRSEEPSENLLIHTAQAFNVRLWPEGHKNHPLSREEVETDLVDMYLGFIQEDLSSDVTIERYYLKTADASAS